jgi:hypothetical protein
MEIESTYGYLQVDTIVNTIKLLFCTAGKMTPPKLLGYNVPCERPTLEKQSVVPG